MITLGVVDTTNNVKIIYFALKVKILTTIIFSTLLAYAPADIQMYHVRNKRIFSIYTIIRCKRTI